MKKLVKLISIILVLAYLLSIPLSALAAVEETGGSAAGSLLKKWQGYGLVNKSVTSGDLDKAIQKIEFISLINGIMKPVKKANIGFSDIPKDTWYGEEIAKAVAAGYVDNQNNTKFNPFSNITRLEAAIMVKRVFGLELKDKRLINKITDAQALDSKQVEEFAAIIEKGGLSQVGEGRYAPSGVLKYADALTMLDVCVGEVVTESGTISDNIFGNMLVNTGAVTLKDMNISGDLTIGEGVGEGDVRLDSVSINGKLIIRGGGPNSVTLTNTKINGFLVVDKSAGNVHVRTIGTTTINETYVKSGCFLEEANLTSGKGFVDVVAEKSSVGGQALGLKGDFDKLAVTESNINVSLNGKAGVVDISQGSISNFTLSTGSISTFTSKASKNIIEILGGTVTTLNIDSGAKGNKLTINGAATISDINVKESTAISIQKGTVERLTLESASEGSNLNIASGAYLKNITANAAATITGSGSITNAYIYASSVSMSIKPSGEYVKGGSDTTGPGGTYTDPALPKIVITNVSNRTILVGSNTQKLNARASNAAEIFYSSTDNSIVTVGEKGELTGVSVGSTTVHVSAIKTGYAPAIATITVNVISDNTSSAGSLVVSPATGNAGTIIDNFIIRYTAGENMTSGRVVIKLPAGFSASERDTVSIGSGAETALTKAQIIDAFTLSFSNVALASGDTIEVRLKNKEIPTGTQFIFSAVADADGMGPKLPAGEVSFMFTSDSLKVLQGGGTNYSEPEPGTAAGTTQISTLSFINVYGASKWLISNTIAVPVFDQVLTGTEYEARQNMPAVAGQQLLLAAVDGANRVKAYAIITINASMIRKDDAASLDPAAIVVEPGIQAGTVSINNLDQITVNGAAAWMTKVQDTPSSVIIIDSVFEGAENYTDGTDVKVNDNQYIVLAAVDSETGKRVKAYVSMPVAGKVSLPAGNLVKDINYSEPEYGTSVGTITIKNLTPRSSSGSNGWKYAVLSKAAAIPAMGVLTSNYEKYYTESGSFINYNMGDNIPVAAGQHVLLVETDAGMIKAYADITVEPEMVRQENAPEMQTPTNYSLPVMGTQAGTTMFTYLSPNLNGSSLAANGWKYMYKVQDTQLSAPPQINSVMAGAQDCTVNSSIPVIRGANKHLILLVTDANGRIKAYADIAMQDEWIRPEDALKLEISLNDYSKPVPGTTSGAITLELSSNRVSGFANWMYKLSDLDFEVPYVGSEIAGTSAYIAGDDINDVRPGAYLLIIAVDGSGKTLAYLKEKILYTQIKQPDAGKLVSIAENSVNFNYSVPEPGDKAGQTKIAALRFWGVNDATAWRYKIVHANPPATVEYNSIATNAETYLYYANLGVSINDGEYLVLYAVDKNNQIKAYRNIKVSEAQIKTPEAPELKLNTNYTAPSAGGTQGTIVIPYLHFRDLDSLADYTGWTWRYVAGNNKFSAPAKNSSINDINGTGLMTTATNIQVSPKQYVLLLAVDSTGIVRGYANIYVSPDIINPGDAELIPSGNYHLAKGTSEGTTSFDRLITVGLDSTVTKWMIKVQPGALTGTPPKNTKVAGSYLYPINGTDKNIPVQLGDHILLLATDNGGYVKAYADIAVTEDVIQAPFAMSLVINKNYTLPIQGETDGTVTMVLQDTDIPKDVAETIVWKYKKSVAGYRAHLNESAPTGTGQFTVCESGKDMKVEPGYWLLVATAGDKIKAYKVLNIDETLIKPSEAPALVEDKNYKAPVPGDLPGTAKITNLTFSDVTGAENCIWKVKVINTDEKLMVNSVLNNADNYTSGNNITARVGQFIVLVAVDRSSNKVRAYKNIEVKEGNVNAPALTAVENYSSLRPGTAKGTTALYVSPEDTKYIVRVVDSTQNIAAGSIITYAAGPGAGYNYSAYSEYSSGTNIKAEAGKYILLVAVDAQNPGAGSGKVLAYTNIKVLDSNLMPGEAALLKTPQNYAGLLPGTNISTVQIPELDFVGLPAVQMKWIVKVQNTSPSAIMLNSIVESPTVDNYKKGGDIPAREGQYVILYAAEIDGNQAKVKAYAVIEVKPESVKGVAPLLQIGSPILVPGSAINTTVIDVSKVPTPMPSGATVLKYIVQSGAAGVILKDSQSTAMAKYITGTDIQVQEGQHLILAATDAAGLIKAYADILVSSADIRSVVATLGGSLISEPVDESKIALGGQTITVTLEYAQWQDDVLSDKAKRDKLFDGFKASGSEVAKWTNVITVLKNEGSKAVSMSADKKTIYISLSEAVYDITSSQEISLTIPAELIKGANKAVAATNTIKIAANALVQVSLQSETGSTLANFGVGDIRLGKKKIVLTLPNGEFAADVATSAEKRNAIFDGLVAANNPSQWASVIAELKNAQIPAINRNSSSKITITLPAVTGYTISTIETISVTVPCKTISDSPILVGAINNAVAATQINIYPNVQVTLAGTLLSGQLSERDIAEGKKTLTITLQDGQWATDITSQQKRELLFAGLVAASSTDQWKKVITALNTAGQSAITRTNNTVVEIVFPAVSGYDITSEQDVSIKIPETCVIGAKGDLIAGQVTVQRVATTTLSGTAAVTAGISESDLKLGGKTIIVTLKDATWVNDIETNTAVKNALFDGFTADVDTVQWANVVAALKDKALIKKNSSTAITITLPMLGDDVSYDLIAQQQTVRLTIPTTAVIGTVFDVKSTNSLVIKNTPPAAAKVKDISVSGNVFAYKTNDVITIKVEFDTAVDVTGSPVLKLNISNTSKDAVYKSKLVNVLTFEYKVQAGDTATKLDYKAASSLTLPLGTAIVTSGSTVKANVTLPSPGKAGSIGDSLKIPIVVDAVAPKFVTTYPKEGTKTENTANILVKTDDEAKIYYIAVLTSANTTPPTADQVVDEAKGNITGFSVAAGSKSVAKSTEGTLAIEGLNGDTKYTVYMVAEDILGNISAVTKIDFTTKDTTPPTVTITQKTPISDSKIEINIQVNELGTAYMIALPVNSNTPTKEQVMAPNTIGVPNNLKATGPITSTSGVTTLTLTGLGFSADYVIYAVCKDASGNVSDPMSTPAKTSMMSFAGVAVDLSKKQISNTTTLMEFSYDKDVWKPCLNGNTTISYSDSDNDLTIYMREKINPTNIKQLGIFVRENVNVITKALISYDISQGKVNNQSAVNLQYRINGGAWGTLNAMTSAVNVVFVPGSLEVRTAATQTTLPSVSVTVDTIPVQEPEPELAYDDDTNEITGLQGAYEYRIGTGAWTSGSIKGDFSGTKDVEVRKKATNRALPSKSQLIHFKAGSIEVTAAPGATTTGKKTVTITFEENTNTPALTDIKSWLLVGQGNVNTGVITIPHDWGTGFTAKWSAADTITLEYDTMANATVKIGDVVNVTADAGIQNAAGNSGNYTLKGEVAGKFNNVPSITSIKALNSGNQNGLGNGDSIVITFDQPVKEGNALNKDNIDTYLTVKDKNGVAKPNAWDAVTIASSITWDADKTTLTIKFDNIAAAANPADLLAASDKVTVDTSWKLTDKDATTEYCNSSSLIIGSFTPAPEIVSVSITSDGTPGLSVGDTVKITFSQPTNAKQLTQAQLRSYFKILSSDKNSSHSWGYQDAAGISWNTAGTVLTIKISNITGVTLISGDLLTLDTSADIMDKDEGVQAVGKDIVVGGSY